LLIYAIKWHQPLNNSQGSDDRIDCRPGEMVQVVSNLIGNAGDSLIESKVLSPQIEIRLREEGSLLYLCIIDNGPGVSSEHCDKIFESFYTTKAQGKGTGLGLSISKQIIENHGGQIYINKQISYSCFELKLPLKHTIAGAS
jgi:signal transduction histidine kinase